MSVYSKFLSLQSAVPRTLDLSNASSILGLANLQLLGSTSGYIQMAANATTTPYTLTWPAAVAASSGYVLTSDTSGVLTWAAAATSGITQLTGDVTAGPGSGSQVATLATVNSNVGTFASVTVNGKGLVTAAAALSGDATTSGSTLTLATVNSNTGTFASVTVNGKGLVTAAAALSGDVTTSGSVASLVATSNATITTLSALTTASSLSSVGTISSGTWHGTAIGAIYGGTGQTSYTTGDTLYASATNVLSKLSIGTSGYVLTVVGGIPSWQPSSSGSAITSLTGDVTATGPGAAAATVQAIQGSAVSATPPTDGQILIWVNGTPAWTPTSVSGDATLSNTGALTLATVNSNTGSFGSSTSIPTFTVNGKGLITAASGNAVVAPAGTLSGTTLNSTVVSSSLTSLGTQSQALNMGGNQINDLAMAGSPAGTDATNVTYVTAQIAAAINGLTWKGPVSAYATSNVPLTGGATLTIDSYAVQNGNYVILSNQTTASQNNVYVASGIGTAYTLSLAPSAELTTAIGDAYLIEDGAVWANSAVQANAISPNNTYIQFAGPNFYTFTSPLSLTGTTVSLNYGSTLTLLSSALVVNYDNVTLDGSGTGGALEIKAAGVGTTQLANSGVTYAKIQSVTASRLLGNPTGGSAAPSEISLGATLTFSGSALQTSALTGDVTTSANSFATTLATVNAGPGTFAIATVTVNGKGLVTSASAATTTGTGSTVVLSASPALTGTVTAVNETLSGNLIAPILQTSATYGGTTTLPANITYAMRWGIPAITVYTFTIPSSSITAGTVYTNNGQTFTTITTTASSTSLAAYGTGAPSASGTLTFVSGSPSGNLAFSAFTSAAETVGQLYVADWNTSLTSNDMFWIVGLYTSTSTTANGASIAVTRKGTYTLGSSDTTFTTSTDGGKPVWLGSSGTYAANSAFSPASGDANFKLGIVTSSTTIDVDCQMMGVS